MVFSPQSWKRVTTTQGGPQRTARNHATIPLETLEFLVFHDGPHPQNSVSLETPLALHAKSYGLLKTLETLVFLTFQWPAKNKYIPLVYWKP